MSISIPTTDREFYKIINDTKTKILRTMRGSTLLTSHLTEYWYRSIHKTMFTSILDNIRRYRMK